MCSYCRQRDCNVCLFAPQMSKMDLNSDDEKDSVETIFTSAIDMLSDDDKKLPQASIHQTSLYDASEF